MRVRIDRDLCMGTESCVRWLPKVFAVDETGVAVVLDMSAEPPDLVAQVAGACPNGAISVDDES
jgi:ferredoxin